MTVPQCCQCASLKGNYPSNKPLSHDPDAASGLCITNIDTTAGHYATEVNHALPQCQCRSGEISGFYLPNITPKLVPQKSFTSTERIVKSGICSATRLSSAFFLWTERTVHIERGNEGIIFDAFETRVSLKGSSGAIG